MNLRLIQMSALRLGGLGATCLALACSSPPPSNAPTPAVAGDAASEVEQKTPETTAPAIAVDGAGEATTNADGLIEFHIGQATLFTVDLADLECGHAGAWETDAVIWRFDREDSEPLMVSLGNGAITLRDPELGCDVDIRLRIVAERPPDPESTAESDKRRTPLFVATTWTWDADADGEWHPRGQNTAKKWRTNLRELEGGLSWDSVEVEDGRLVLLRKGKPWIRIPERNWPEGSSCAETRVQVWRKRKETTMALEVEVRTRMGHCDGAMLESTDTWSQAQKSMTPSHWGGGFRIDTEYGSLFLSDGSRCSKPAWGFVGREGGERLELTPCTDEEDDEADKAEGSADE